MSFEQKKVAFESVEDIKEEDREALVDQEKINYYHDLLWRIISDEKINSLADIPKENLPELIAAAEIFSQPNKFGLLIGGAASWQISKAEKIISELLREN